MKKGVLVLAVVLVTVAGGYYILRLGKERVVDVGEAVEPVVVVVGSSNGTAEKTAVPAVSETARGDARPTETTTNVAERAGAVPAVAAAAELPAAVSLENVGHAIHQYRAMFGSNPVGTNEEITRALNGNNPKQINFIDAQAGMRVNAQGELVDAWGTPLFFHQLSGAEMEVRSAGPDRKMWTVDDLVTR